MFHFKIFLIAALIACALCDEGKDKDGKAKWGKEKEKMKQCMHQTKDLQECCPIPKDDDMKNDPECKHHLEGVETMEKKEKHNAYKCFSECIFKKQGVLVDGAIDENKLKELTKKHLTDNNALEFEEIAMSSVDYCKEKLDEKKAKWEKWAAEHKDKDDKKNKDEKKCSMMAGGFVGCVMGNIVRKCPESKWQATAECEALKANVTTMDDCMSHF